MYSFNIDFKRLDSKVEIRINPLDISHIWATFKARIYPPCANSSEKDITEPLFRTPVNILKVVHVKALKKELQKWESSGKLYWVRKGQKAGNETGMDVKISVELAIILFEICEASNQATYETQPLFRLKGNIHGILKKDFNINLPFTVIESSE